MKTLQEVEKEVESFKDNLGEPVDEKIKHTVVALQYLGFYTTASCEGHLDHGFPYPWVDIDNEDKKINKTEKKRLRRLVKEFYKGRESQHPLILQDFVGIRLQNVKWPRSIRKRKKLLDIPDTKLLLEYQTEMQDFADFLLKDNRSTRV